jgi:hypothetical protein
MVISFDEFFEREREEESCLARGGVGAGGWAEGRRSPELLGKGTKGNSST